VVFIWEKRDDGVREGKIATYVVYMQTKRWGRMLTGSYREIAILIATS
jgi:putative sterol carrier protein